MALVTMATGMFVLGVVALVTLQWIVERLLQPMRLPKAGIESLFTGVGFVMSMPFVFTILLEADRSLATFVGVGALMLLGAAIATGYGLFRLLTPALKAEFARI